MKSIMIICALIASQAQSAMRGSGSYEELFLCVMQEHYQLCALRERVVGYMIFLEQKNIQLPASLNTRLGDENAKKYIDFIKTLSEEAKYCRHSCIKLQMQEEEIVAVWREIASACGSLGQAPTASQMPSSVDCISPKDVVDFESVECVLENLEQCFLDSAFLEGQQRKHLDAFKQFNACSLGDDDRLKCIAVDLYAYETYAAQREEEMDKFLARFTKDLIVMRSFDSDDPESQKWLWIIQEQRPIGDAGDKSYQIPLIIGVDDQSSSLMSGLAICMNRLVHSYLPKDLYLRLADESRGIYIGWREQINKDVRDFQVFVAQYRLEGSNSTAGLKKLDQLSKGLRDDKASQDLREKFVSQMYSHIDCSILEGVVGFDRVTYVLEQIKLGFLESVFLAANQRQNIKALEKCMTGQFDIALQESSHASVCAALSSYTKYAHQREKKMAIFFARFARTLMVAQSFEFAERKSVSRTFSLMSLFHAEKKERV
ncbi:MAG: hypothetical protein OXC30_03125 [Alphaproteobacteria bacterium]|nr:hypothetical protein [Alphaproteobacteria bacterium]